MADHALATLSNPTSALTDFTLIVDLSNMPASWWSAVTSSDGTKGRVYKGNGTTELACDWIDFDDTGETGLLRVKWSGTLASSGTQQLWIEPPVSGNSSVASDGTYGSDNAYDSGWWGYWPLHDANDRTANGRNLTAKGSLSFGGNSGQIGNATNFASSTSDYAETTSTLNFDPSVQPHTLVTSFKCDDINGDRGLIGNSTGGSIQFWVDDSSTDYLAAYYTDGVAYGNTAISTATWYQAAVKMPSGGKTFLNGSPEVSGITESVGGATGKAQIGNTSGKYMNGLMQHAAVHTIERGDDWISHEYDQISDNSTFWGTWTWETIGGGVTIPLMMHHYTKNIRSG